MDGGRRHPARAQPHRHPRPRGLLLRGVQVAGGLRGGGPAGRRGAGDRGADAGEPLPRARGRPADHPGAEQDRPAGRAACQVRRGDRAHHRLPALRRAPGLGQDRGGRARAAQRDRHPGAAAAGRPGGAGQGADLRLGLRHLPRGRYLRAGGGRAAVPPGEEPDDVHRHGTRHARGRGHLAGADAHRGAERRRGRLPDHRGQERQAGAGRRHGDQRGQPGGRAAARLREPAAHGVLRPVPGRGRRLPRLPRRAGQAAAERRGAGLRAGDLAGARLRLPLRVPRPAAHGDRQGAAGARVRPVADLDLAERGLPRDHRGRPGDHRDQPE